MLTGYPSSQPVYVIIPSLKGQVGVLVARLMKQTCVVDAIEVVSGVQPNGKARNEGVHRLDKMIPAGTDPLLVFIDDDALPGQDHLLEKLVQPLIDGCQPDVAVTGAARVLPGDASWFQRRVSREIPRTVNIVPDQPLETNPPLEGYGHSLITTTCCATRYSIFERAGGFSNRLTSGVDTDFFYRVRKMGYRFVMVPEVFVEHPAPTNLHALWQKYYWYGIGYGQEVQRRPEQKLGPRLPTSARRLAFILVATLWLVPNIFILWSFGYPKLAFGFRPFKAISTYAVAWGYLRGWSS